MSAMPEDMGPDDVPTTAPDPSHAARREHVFYSLLELSRELTYSSDLFETVDLLLFNLMGQMGCARSALWLFSEDNGSPVLVRCHGFHVDQIRSIGELCNPAIERRFRGILTPLLSSWLQDGCEPHEMAALEQGPLAVIAPLVARGQLLGWLTLGPKVTATPYVAPDLQVLETALGMVAASLQSAMLFKRVQESNRQLRVSNERLKEMDRLKTEFLSNVNHELRTPLAVVTASLECLTGVVPDDTQGRALLEGAIRKSRDLQHIIENLLRFSDMMGARLPVDPVVGEIRPVLERFVRDREPGVATALHILTFEPPEPLPPAQFDPQRLQQILDELMDNALKFTPAGSHLRLRAIGAPVEDGVEIRIELQDDGPGIPREHLSRLFHPFVQVDGSAVRTVGGLGLGLAFASQLAQRMGCRLQADSTPGRGSTFSLILPSANSMRAAA
jgi:signal transduction histidine kinase